MADKNSVKKPVTKAIEKAVVKTVKKVEKKTKKKTVKKAVKSSPVTLGALFPTKYAQLTISDTYRDKDPSASIFFKWPNGRQVDFYYSTKPNARRAANRLFEIIRAGEVILVDETASKK